MTNKWTWLASLTTLLLTASFSPLRGEGAEESTHELSNFRIKGLLLVQSPVEKSTIAEQQGVQIHDLIVPGKVKKLEQVLTTLAIGKPLSPDLLIDIKRTIILYYRSQGHPLVTVSIPQQDITDGVIEVVIIEAKVGKIVCKGNRWFNNKLLQSYLDIEPGDAISNDTLLTDVSWMNRNPFRRSDILFTPGEELGTTDIELITQERFPLRVYAGGDNTGNDATGNLRWFGGFNWGNAFFCDHQLDYQYTSSSDFHKFQAHTIDYTAPLPWRHVLLMFGGYSTVHPKLSMQNEVFKPFKSYGHSAQGSARYQIPIGSLYRSGLKEFYGGCDFKNTNNNLEFIGDDTIPIITKIVNLSQLVAGFNCGKETGHHKFSFSVESFWSPGRIFPHQKNANFENLRPEAKNHYVYGKLTVGNVYHFPSKWAISTLVRGQLADQNLLPSEQYGLGGFNTVRGYNEREVNVDNAFILNIEIWSFPIHLFKKITDDLLLLGFVDYALGSNHKILPGEHQPPFLLGAGPGLRYAISSYASLRVDWGFKLHKVNFEDPGNSKVHFGFMASY